MSNELIVTGVCGSLRAKSYNMCALKAAGEAMPEGMKLRIAGIEEIPMYNQDLQNSAGFPAPVERLREQIAGADGLLIATPEYNHSIPGVLKNALDWLSRMKNQPFHFKAVAVLSAASGPLGGARVQYDIRRVVVPLGGIVLPRPEVFIGMVQTKFDAEGRLADETTRKFLTDQMLAFRDWMLKVRKMTA